MSQQNITAINVFIEIDGQQCIALIKPEMAHIFMHMLPNFQGSDDPSAGANLSKLPPAAVEHLLATRRAIWAHANKSATSAPTTSPYADEAASQAILARGAKWRHQRLQQADMGSHDDAHIMCRTHGHPVVSRLVGLGRCFRIRNGTAYKYPLWQFEPEIFPAIHPVIKALGTKDGWTVLAFMENSQEALGKQSPCNALKSKSASQELIIELAIAQSH